MIRKKSLLLATLVLLCLATVVYAAEPSEPHPANAIWVEPSTVIPPNIAVGEKFNVTIWANSSVNCGGWQIWLIYPSAYINATRANYTGPDGTKSDFFKDINTIPVTPSFKAHNTTHNRVEYGESWAGTGPLRDPGYGSLCWIEFEIVAVPGDGLNELLDFYAYTGSVRRTYLIDGQTGYKVDLNVYPATVVPEFSALILMILLVTSSLAAVIGLKSTKKAK